MMHESWPQVYPSPYIDRKTSTGSLETKAIWRSDLTWRVKGFNGTLKEASSFLLESLFLVFRLIKFNIQISREILYIYQM